LNPRETVSFRCRGRIVDNNSNWQKTLSGPFTISTAIHGAAARPDRFRVALFGWRRHWLLGIGYAALVSGRIARRSLDSPSAGLA